LLTNVCRCIRVNGENHLAESQGGQNNDLERAEIKREAKKTGAPLGKTLHKRHKAKEEHHSRGRGKALRQEGLGCDWAKWLPEF